MGAPTAEAAPAGPPAPTDRQSHCRSIRRFPGPNCPGPIVRLPGPYYPHYIHLALVDRPIGPGRAPLGERSLPPGPIGLPRGPSDETPPASAPTDRLLAPSQAALLAPDPTGRRRAPSGERSPDP